MSIEKDLAAITEVDLRRLIEDPMFEGKTLKYKKALVMRGNEEQKRKLVSGVASFVSAAGGDMIFGMQEDTDSLDLDEAQFMVLMRQLFDPVWNAAAEPARPALKLKAGRITDPSRRVANPLLSWPG